MKERKGKDRHLLFAPRHDFFSLDAGALNSRCEFYCNAFFIIFKLFFSRNNINEYLLIIIIIFL